MIKRLLLLLWVVPAAFKADAQWTLVNSGATEFINGVQMTTSTTGYFAGDEGVFKTTDGGLNWRKVPYAQLDSLTYLSLSESAIYFFDSQTGIAVGSSILNNNGYITRTTDGGNTWSTPFTGLAGGYFMDVWFTSSTTGYAAGTRGTIMTTTNAGISWTTLNSGVQVQLNSVRFDPDTPTNGIVCGDSFVLRTTDGGATWLKVISGGQFYGSVRYAGPGVAYVTGGPAMIKTVDGGRTWDTVTSNLNPGFISFFSPDTGYGTGGQGVIRTFNGGSVYEQEAVPDVGNCLYFYDTTLGFMGSEYGHLYRTANAGGSNWKPAPAMNLGGNYFCNDSVAYFNTGYVAGYSYQWVLNHQLISTLWSDTMTMQGNNTADTLLLIVSDGINSDTVTSAFSVYSVAQYNAPAIYGTDTQCNHLPEYLVVSSADTGAYYELFGDTSLQYFLTFTYGTGSSVSFNISSYTDTLFTVVAVPLNGGGCAGQALRSTIIVKPPIVPPPVYTMVPPVVCNGDSATLVMQNSQVGTTYNLYVQYGNEVATARGTGGTLYFSLPKLENTTTYFMQTVYHGDCYGGDSAATVIVRQFVVNVSMDENVLAGQDLQITNLSNGDSYLWRFDSSANVLSDTAAQPAPVYYNTTGTKYVKVNVNTNAGNCSDSLVVRVRVNLPLDTAAPGQLCNLDTIPNITGDWAPEGENILAYHADRFGNQYVAGFYYSDLTPDGEIFYYLQKFDRNNKLLWQKVSDYSQYSNAGALLNYYSAFISGITTDPVGNVYICGNYSAPAFILDSVVIPSDYASPDFYVAKLDTTGAFQWLVHSNNSSSYNAGLVYSGATDVLYSDEGHVYVTIFGTQDFDTLFRSDGASVPIPDNTSCVLQLDSRGNYIRQFAIGSGGLIQDNNDDILDPDPATLDYAQVAMVSPKMHLRSDGKVVLTGEFTGSLAFGTKSVSSVYTYAINGYYALLDSALGWQGAWVTYKNEEVLYGNDIIPASCVDKDGNVYVVAQTNIGNPAGLFLPNGKNFQDSTQAEVVLKFNQNGTLLWTLGTNGTDIKSLAISDNSDTVYLYGEFYSFLGFDSINGSLPKGVAGTTGQNAFLAAIDSLGRASWVLNISSDTFMGPFFMEKNCGGVLNCLGYSTGRVSVKNQAISNNYLSNFIFHYDPTGQNCQPQVCPADFELFSTVRDTILFRDTTYRARHYVAHDTIIQYGGSSYLVDTSYRLGTFIVKRTVNNIDSTAYNYNYQTYNNSLALQITNYVDSLVYFDTAIFQVDTDYVDTMLITITVAGITATGDNALKLSVYPNPSAGYANISYQLPGNQHVTLLLFDDLGRLAQSVFEGQQAAGDHNIVLRPGGLSAGVYWLILTANDETAIRKVVLTSR